MVPCLRRSEGKRKYPWIVVKGTVHGFVGCFVSHSDDFQGAIDHIIDDDLFLSLGQKLRAN